METPVRNRIILFVCEELSTLAFQLVAGFAIYKLGSEWIVDLLLKHGSISPFQKALTLLTLIIVGTWLSLGIGSTFSSLAWSVLHKQQ